MKNTIRFTCISLIILFAIPSFATISTINPIPQKEKKRKNIFKELSSEELLTLSNSEIKEKVGRKLKLREKLALKIIRKIAKNSKKKKTEKDGPKKNIYGILSLTFAIAGLCLLLFPLFGLLLVFSAIALGIIGLINDEPKKGLSIGGIIVGGVASLVIPYAILIILILLSL